VTEMLEALKELLRARVPKDDDSPGCQLCEWILLDLEAHDGKLKGWNLDVFKKPIFPKEGEIAHLKLEGFPFVESVL
jgi:hypothetical protein